MQQHRWTWTFKSFNTRVPKDEEASVQLGALIREAKPFSYSRTPVPSRAGPSDSLPGQASPLWSLRQRAQLDRGVAKTEEMFPEGDKCAVQITQTHFIDSFKTPQGNSYLPTLSHICVLTWRQYLYRVLLRARH